MKSENQVILSNQIECLHCGDMPYSAHRHDFKSCKCGKVEVDGGMDYIKRGGNREDYIEQCISMDKALLSQLVEDIDEAKATGRNSLGLVCTFVRTLRDEGYCITEKEV